MKEDLGVFVGQSKTRLIRGRKKFKVKNSHPPSCEDPVQETWVQENYPKELNRLEEAYKEFCEKAFDIIVMHPSMNGANVPHRIIFPDFYYDIIPDKFPVE